MNYAEGNENFAQVQHTYNDKTVDGLMNELKCIRRGTVFTMATQKKNKNKNERKGTATKKKTPTNHFKCILVVLV